MMTKSTAIRIRHIYEKTVGYDPLGPGGGWTIEEAIMILRQYRAEGYAFQKVA